jgi:hypothetical protein
MPILRKKISPALRLRIKQLTNRAKVITSSGRRKWSRKAFGWDYENSTVREIDQKFSGKLIPAIDALSNGARVLDLGCGKLEAVSQLAKTHSKLGFFGISRDVYSEFAKIEQKNIEVLVEREEIAIKYLQKKGMLMDIVYSHLGPRNIFNGSPKGIKKFNTLKSILSVGGKAFLNPVEVQLNSNLRRKLEEIGFEVNQLNLLKKTLILTRVK